MPGKLGLKSKEGEAKVPWQGSSTWTLSMWGGETSWSFFYFRLLFTLHIDRLVFSFKCLYKVKYIVNIVYIVYRSCIEFLSYSRLCPSPLLHLKVGLPPSFPWYLNPLTHSQHVDHYQNVGRQVCLASWDISHLDPLSLWLAYQFHWSLGKACLIN